MDRKGTNPKEFTSVFDASSSHALMSNEKYAAAKQAIESTPNAKEQLKLYAEAKASFSNRRDTNDNTHDRNGVPYARAAEQDYLDKNPKLRETLKEISAKANKDGHGIDTTNILDVAQDLRRSPNKQLGKMHAQTGDHGLEPANNARDVVRQEREVARTQPKTHQSTPSPSTQTSRTGTPAAAHGFHEGHPTSHTGAAAARRSNHMDAAFASIQRGDGAATVAKEVGKAALYNIPIAGPALEGRFAEAAIQLASRVTAPLAVTGVGAVAHAGAEMAARKLAKELGGDVNDQIYMAELAGTLAKIVYETSSKTPRMSEIILADTKARTTQKNILKDAGLGDFVRNGQTVSPETALRDPAQRDTFVASLKQSMESAPAGKTRDDLATMYAAAVQFTEIEGRRLAKLEPYTKQLSTELATIAKAHGQQPATQAAQPQPETDPIKLLARAAVQFEVPPQDAGSTRMNANGGRQQQTGRSA